MSDLAFAIIALAASLVSLGVSTLMYLDTSPVQKHLFARLVPERWRRIHRWYAHFAQYAWQPCPLCGRDFGGHEWRDINGLSSAIPNPASEWWGGLGICPACTRAGYGHRKPFHLPDQHHLKGE